MTRDPGQTQHDLDWDAEVPVSPHYGDSYYSRTDGLAEARHVFLAGNNLPARVRDGFHIAELGFGTGLNLLAALHAFRASGARGALHYTGFEAHPIPVAAMQRALAAFPVVAAIAAPLLEWWRDASSPLILPDLHATVHLGDATRTLPGWNGHADAWFLDGFAPDRNPALWTPALMTSVARHTAPGGTFATYSAAGHVRRALAGAGFAVTRLPGHGRKRHMSVGILERRP